MHLPTDLVCSSLNSALLPTNGCVGIFAAIACNLLIIVIVICNTIYFRAANKKVDRYVHIVDLLRSVALTGAQR